MNRKLIGVDIGGTTIKIGIITYEGELLHKWEIPTDKRNSANHIPEDIWNSIQDKLTEQHIERTSIVGIGVGAPGFVDTSTGNVSVAVNIGWRNFDLGQAIHELSKLPVYVDNDANIAAVGENWKGSGNLAENIIAITLGTGVGGGIIANGHVINGTNGTAGEIGHITVEPEGGAPCNCGRTGCLETVTSATGIARQAKEAVDAGKDTRLKQRLERNQLLTAKDVFDLAKEGDNVSQSIVAHVTDTLGYAIANVATVINPSKIVIGGGVSKAGEDLLRPLRYAFEKYALPRINEGCEFVIAALENDAGIYGGAYLVKQNHS
ncbi:glucokinase [Paraliobacillus ryukyuensis]|uniref:Glucokinase n=1 Tax=Paraliobacillus ryukyuensis TaxID=200904 RepID=A0A366EG39_9BACI|nr:ROK family glucokinase [Paraliobacillus ryukyuensis]RBP01401.1 glucokinase [Paraliobacillus ryukyuensis]